MDLFEDGLYVRLRSRTYGTYLCADEDAKGVGLHPDRASLRAAWVVHLLVRDGVPFDLLRFHSAASGRYLAASDKLEPLPLGLGLAPRGYGVALRDYDHLEEFAIRWTAVPSPSAGHILLCTMYRGGKLRAHGGYLSNASVYIDDCDDANAAPMKDWEVEVVPLEQLQINLHHQPKPLPVRTLGGLLRPAQSHGLTARIVKVKRQFPWHFEDEEDEEWWTVNFTGTSLLNLSNKLKNMVGTGYAIYIQAGYLGRLTRLLHDLPRNRDTIHIVLLLSDIQDDVYPYPSSKILNPNGEAFELGVGLSTANMLMEHSSKSTQMEAANDASRESYLWLVCNGHEADEAISQWYKNRRPDNAVVDLAASVVFSDMQSMLRGFLSAGLIKLVKRSAKYRSWIREYRALASISHLPCPPKEVSARFAAGSQQDNCIMEPWVMVN
ncbi:unnamed protein product [Urochloa decumbens]|uniref:DUF569 domain-containing protein n=1 Tax=Urochloa decumbens TaxID=240449 RepID=A0ABC9H1F0_9POAL